MVKQPAVNRPVARQYRFESCHPSQNSAMTALRQSIVLNSQLYA